MSWVAENSKPVIDKLDQVNTKQNAKPISPCDFSALYTKSPHKDLVKVLFYLINFGFHGGLEKRMIFP